MPERVFDSSLVGGLGLSNAAERLCAYGESPTTTSRRACLSTRQSECISGRIDLISLSGALRKGYIHMNLLAQDFSMPLSAESPFFLG